MNVSQYEITCDKIYVWKLDLLEIYLQLQELIFETNDIMHGFINCKLSIKFPYILKIFILFFKTWYKL